MKNDLAIAFVSSKDKRECVTSGIHMNGIVSRKTTSELIRAKDTVAKRPLVRLERISLWRQDHIKTSYTIR